MLGTESTAESGQNIGDGTQGVDLEGSEDVFEPDDLILEDCGQILIRRVKPDWVCQEVGVETGPYGGR